MLNKLFKRNFTVITGQIPAGVQFEVWADLYLTATVTYTTRSIVNFEVSVDSKGKIVKFECDDPNFPTRDLTPNSESFILNNM